MNKIDNTQRTIKDKIILNNIHKIIKGSYNEQYEDYDIYESKHNGERLLIFRVRNSKPRHNYYELETCFGIRKEAIDLIKVSKTIIAEDILKGIELAKKIQKEYWGGK